jgi:hypothetical protein
MKRIIILSILFLAVGFSQNIYVSKNDQMRLSPRLLNYQGYLTDTLGNPITNPTVSMTFAIFDAVSSGNQKWTETQSTVSVNKGIFHVLLGSVTPIPDSVFATSANRWLALTVAGQILSPRTRIVSAPFAYTATYSDTATYARNAAADNDWNFLVSDGADTTLQTGGRWGLARAGNVLYGPYDSTHVNLGVACTTGTSGQNYKYCTVGGGYLNIAGNAYATVSGGWANTASGLYSTVAGGRSNIASVGYATIGGGYDNTVNASWATVAGGNINSASGNNAVVSGGQSNSAGNSYATVAGGYADTAIGYAATVAGGYDNIADGDYATVAGGRLNIASGNYATVGGGWTNNVVGVYAAVVGGYRNVASGNYAFVAGGYADTAKAVYGFVGSGHGNLAGDSLIDTAAVVAGGYNNTAIAKYAFIGGGYVDSAKGVCSTIGGGAYNEADSGFSTVAGGSRNIAWNTCATVAGGYANSASGYYSTVGGGYGNNAGAYYAIVAGGLYNLANGARSFVGGGSYDTASAAYATVSGGYRNTASGDYATIAGGYDNTASGTMSFAGGYKANAAHRGSFVWADSTGSSYFSSTAVNQFRVRATGGIDFTGNVAIRNPAGVIVVELGEGLDYAEGFDVRDKGRISPGAVLAIDPENPGNLKMSDRPYDTKVAGIAAGAKKLGSGVRLGNGRFDCDVALAGRVYCNVDATELGIEPGDLLTTSETPGYAMKVTDYNRGRGAILGKAMQKLDQGKKGQILVLVTLQ